MRHPYRLVKHGAMQSTYVLPFTYLSMSVYPDIFYYYLTTLVKIKDLYLYEFSPEILVNFSPPFTV